MITLLMAAKLVALSYNLALQPDALVQIQGDTVWLSQTQDPESVLAQLPERQQRQLLDHILFPGDRARIFGQDALLGLSVLHHKLGRFARVKKMKRWLPPGAFKLITSYHKDPSTAQAKNVCLAAAYDVAFAEYLLDNGSDIKMKPAGLEFLQKVILSGSVSMSPEQALKVMRSAADPKGKSPVQVLMAFKRKRSKAYSAALSDYYALVQKSSPKARKAQEYYLKGVDAYAEGDYSRAIVWWTKAQKLDPENQEIKTALEKARKLAGK